MIRELKFAGGISCIAVMLACLTICAQSAHGAHKSDSFAVTQWTGRKAAIEKALSNRACGRQLSVDIVDAFGEAGDDLSVALVDACQDGAYTDEIVALRLERGLPSVARFRDARRKPVPNSFLNGASVMHSRDVKLMPEKKAVADYSADNDSEGKPAKCEVKIYVWSGRSKTFDLDVLLSKDISSKHCQELKSAQ